MTSTQQEQSSGVHTESVSADSVSSDIENEAEPDLSIDDVAVKASVDDYSWEELGILAQEIAGATDDQEALGIAIEYGLCSPNGVLNGTQRKMLELADGTSGYAAIAGFRHDDTETGGRAGITFLMQDCLYARSMCGLDLPMAGWRDCKMRHWLNEEVIDLLPDELAEIIVPVAKRTNNVGHATDSSCVSTTIDGLWLPSFVELCGFFPADAFAYDHKQPQQADIYNEEGRQYKLYSDLGIDYNEGTAHRVSSALSRGRSHTIESNFNHWYTRTPKTYEDNMYRSFTTDEGRVGFADTTAYFGVAPGFCI